MVMGGRRPGITRGEDVADAQLDSLNMLAEDEQTATGLKQSSSRRRQASSDWTQSWIILWVVFLCMELGSE